MNTQLLNTQVTHDVCCVLYARDTGQIVFLHRVTTIGEAQLPTDSEIEEEARANLKVTIEQYRDQLPIEALEERPIADLSALMVSAYVFRPRRHYMVDTSTGKLIETERPKPQNTAE